MKTLRFLAAALILAGVVASLVVEFRAGAGQRARDALLNGQAAQLAALSAENERLARIVEQQKNSETLSKDQLRELLRLRGQVGLLRELPKEKDRLEKTNAQLHAAAADAEKQLAAAQAAPNYWPKDQLAFAGFADPESALKSILWTMNNGDVRSWEKMCSPEAVAQLQHEQGKHGRSDAEIAADLKQMADSLLAASSGFHILQQKALAPDKVLVDLSFDGEGVVRKFVLKKIGGEWKFHDLLVAGQAEPER